MSPVRQIKRALVGEAAIRERHHGAGHQAVPTPERTMSPVRQIKRALVGEAAIRELGRCTVKMSLQRGSHPHKTLNSKDAPLTDA